MGKNPSGMNEENIESMKMERFRKQAGRNDNNRVFQYAQTFKHIEAAAYIATQPKFQSNCMKKDVLQAVEELRESSNQMKQKKIKLYLGTISSGRPQNH